MLTTEKITNLKSDLAKIENLLNHYQNVFAEDGETSKKEQSQLKKMLLFIKKAEKKIAILYKKQQKSIDSVSKIKIKDSKAIDKVSQKIQDTIPDFLPAVKGIIDGCNITIMNYGSVSIDGQNFLQGGIQFFAINSNPVETIKVPKNCTGTISIKSTWIYSQDPEGITFHSWGKKTQTASRSYSIDYTFKVDEEGNIQIFKGTVTKESDILNDIADLIFYIRDLEVGLDSNNLLSFTGGIYENTKSVLPEAITHYLSSQKINQKELTTSFSLVLELKKEKKQKVSPQTKELVFESKNQAILSSDQKSVCLEWWSKLNKKLKEDVRNKKAKIVIQGFASPPGSNEYNNQLGLDRAKNVAKLLTPKIGTDLKGDPLCIFNLIGEGEETDDPRRYVRITIVKL